MGYAIPARSAGGNVWTSPPNSEVIPWETEGNPMELYGMVNLQGYGGLADSGGQLAVSPFGGLS